MRARGKLPLNMRLPSDMAAMFGMVATLVELHACQTRRPADDVSARHGSSPMESRATDASQQSSNPARPSDTKAPNARPRVPNSVSRYDFRKPSQVWLLPEPLREISDIALLSNDELACVQDEKGVVYVYHLGTSRITDMIHFGARGDYEGIAVVGERLFVLRSDGRLYQLSRLTHHPSVRTFDLGLPKSEAEGLCLDEQHARLLITIKGHEEGRSKDLRPIFAFDLSTETLSVTPAIELNVHDVRHFAKEHELEIPRHINKNGDGMRSALRVMPSALGVHPVTGEIYLLSSVDHVLISCTGDGDITGYVRLDTDRFRQPEGIAFFANGDMLISNEGHGKQATLLRLDWQASSQ